MDTKQVIVMRKDLGMRKGKMVAQGCHASMGAIFSQSYVKSKDLTDGIMDHKCIPMSVDVEHWFNDRFTEICVSCNSEQELLDLTAQAKDAGLLHFLCRDAGLTEFAGIPTYTALAIGPASAEIIDKITGQLKLL